MGQYFAPVLLDEDGKVTHTVNSHHYNNGLKLMEHSYLDNQFVAVVETVLANEGPSRVVWAGDYAATEPEATTSPDDWETLWTRSHEQGLKVQMVHPDLDKPEYSPFDGEPNYTSEFLVTTKSHPFVVNHTKKTYVDKRNIPHHAYLERAFIHPLPLLTADGNGGGGGDYFGPDPDELVGSWSRDVIGIETSAPEGYTELSFNLTEEPS